MAQTEDLRRKRRRSWYVTLILAAFASAVYTALLFPIMMIMGFSVWLIYPALYLATKVNDRFMLGAGGPFIWLGILHFLFCLVEIRLLYWFMRRIGLL